MNSRQRVLKAVNFEQPDRVPIDLGGIRASGQGGYVFNQVHNIQQNVPVENVEAMLNAAHEFGLQK